jgi:Protein of unknown function, DUF481
MRTLATMLGALALFAGSSVAYADNPTFTYGTYEEKKVVEWKATASAGLLLSTGNSNQLSFTGAAMGSRDDGRNKLQLDASGSYARASVLVVDDVNMNNVIDPGDLTHKTLTSTALWNTKLRYDRFFSANNLGYIDAFAWGNEPAGKKVVAGGQAGYSRQLFKNDVHLFKAEIGYDFSYELFVTGSPDKFYLHSLRLFLGYVATLTKDTSFNLSVEYLGNMNSYNGPYAVRVSSFGDSRVNGQTALTTRIWKKLSFQISFTAKYDNVPAPIPISGLLSGFTFASPQKSESLDTITAATLLMSFL